MEKLSFVIPCYGSELTIKSVIDEINGVMSQKCEQFSHEIICVNDCSPDNVLKELKSIAANQIHVTIINLARNNGKHSAVMAGYSLVSGDYVVNLDDDGQCPMDKLWDMIDELKNGYDIVTAEYHKKKQSTIKNLGSNLNNQMSRIMLGKPKGIRFENFSVARRFIIDEVLKYQNPYPYLEGLYLRTSFNISTIKMDERERIAGTGNFTFRKSLSLWFNGFTAFSVKPLRIATFIGIFSAAFGFLFAIVLVIRYFLGDFALAGYASTMVTILFFNGITMMLIGLVGEYVGRVYISINNSPQYVIREIIKGGVSGTDHRKP